MAKLLNVASVAKMLGVSGNSVYNWCQSGKMPEPVRVGSRICGWHPQIIESWILGDSLPQRVTEKANISVISGPFCDSATSRECNGFKIIACRPLVKNASNAYRDRHRELFLVDACEELVWLALRDDAKVICAGYDGIYLSEGFSQIADALSRFMRITQKDL